MPETDNGDGEKCNSGGEREDIHGQDITALLAIMRALRTPGTGCPWDLEQDFSTIAPYTVEEAYEVSDAIARENYDDLCDELGDLLLQVIYHAQMAEEIGKFSFDQVVAGICDKMIRRHPHVFGDQQQRSLGQVNSMWEDIKAQERVAKKQELKTPQTSSVLSGVPATLPPLTRAIKLQEKVARVGFDWKNLTPVFAKVLEELEEVKGALACPVAEKAVHGEVGDLLFAVTNLARHLEINPESALASTNQKFTDRFGKMEQSISRSGNRLEEMSLEQLEHLWQEAKLGE